MLFGVCCSSFVPLCCSLVVIRCWLVVICCVLWIVEYSLCGGCVVMRVMCGLLLVG